ncbi:MAG: hypothetical protein M3R49_00640 [Chloroflexota bacterium]|nr:hypothetical protein [Chloroflexota bacterium]
MPTSHPALPRSRPAAGLAAWVVVVVILIGCTTAEPLRTPRASAPAQSAEPRASPSPTPTPIPSPRYTNEPDPTLAALIPRSAAGATIVVVPPDEYGLTPGDIGEPFGDLGGYFHSLVIGYVLRPRATLYAMRVEGRTIVTRELRPHLAEIGRYVGIAGLHPEKWRSAALPGHLVWVRPEDNATAAGTMIYAWAADQYVFLLIGVDDRVNRAVIAALPGEAPPTPTPVPSRSPLETVSPSPVPAPSG